MPNFKVSFPDRVVEPIIGHGGCCMASCTDEHVQRGTSITIQAMNKREAWDNMHRQFPFERIVVE
jgi:hypothetical protein